ncbi:magnesium transporter MgtE N-terminal domain-containing protein [Nocardioides donggukensis]|uniref:Magnesium transporter MgtE intracellular domain-containing protein n=1 Tax=Nocardioides donggukensis TaxID=2774019 RepID=A0A927K6N7_9ACTN|nr:hypothetical protein [Nocardioides donggukensis]MBD8871189.1 hypothetical protein [Nocardioides donggukensis]
MSAAGSPAPSSEPDRQVGRLARLLGVDAAELDGLAELPDEDLRMLHGLVSEHLFGHARHRFAGIADLTRRLPGGVAGKLSERFLPPRMAARVAELLDPPRAAALAVQLSPDYLAELALALDPSRSEDVIQAVPPEAVGRAARSLFDREEYAGVAELVPALSDEALVAAVEAATSRDLLELAPLLVWDERIHGVVAELPDARLDALLGEVADEGLWSHGERLLTRLDPAVLDRLVERAADVGAEVVGSFEAASAAGLLGPESEAMLGRALEVRAGAPK